MLSVLLVYHNALFAHSIHVALRSTPGIHLVGELQDWTRFDAEFTRLSPDVLLVEEDQSTETDAILAALRMRQSSWRVVAMRLDETTIHIWSGTGKKIQKTQDLYNALGAIPIRGGKTRARRGGNHRRMEVNKG